MSAAPTASGVVELTLSDDIAVLRLNRPERCNALSLDMWEAIGAQVQAAAHASPRALIVTGVGPHFCAGMDLKPDNMVAARAASAIFQRDAPAARTLIEELKGYLAALRGFPAPTIAAIEGVCIGGGMEVALHCDIRVAATDARLGLPETRIGMVPDVGGTTLLGRLVGPGRATLVITSGREFSGEESARMGMVEELCPPGQALARARAVAEQIAMGAPKATRHVLGVLRQASGLPIDAAFDLETEAGVAALVGGEPIEGLSAFAEKRAPRW